ncbi:hypothetical protein HYH02_005963 [Chlamydomonas schloesseri]|uniref:EF-hand domain-containing protein n=1 Tax=Chlamydomonas schloesseri TaxID=2026947 RepID=A0A835WKQ8_9CHLO|nr:hypothetical protein HYH02_005963 [Chlamydomonas schloesseri]|eukprot:KAG2449216.1 hypothetical protein HYH02_005963 [Chlamydomonas schloesseri]
MAEAQLELAGRSLMGSYTDKPDMQGWELTALFFIFLLITLAWDLLVGILTFLNNILRGRKANWLARVKEELLALGVVSLVLLFVEPTLQQICMPVGGSSSEDPNAPSLAPPAAPATEVQVPYGTYLCPVGSRQVFARTVIHAAHYLLFYLAIVHILFSLLTSVITNVKLSKWSILERTSRKEQNIPAVTFIRISTAITRAKEMASPSFLLRLREVWRDSTGYVDQDLYSLLRYMCEKRFRAHHVVLRNFNFLNMCEQCLEAELNEVYSHAWLLVFMMSLLLLYNRIVYQIVWFCALSICALAVMSGNLRWVMKKTAREARNLWRKIEGQTGAEFAEDEEGYGDEYELEGEEGEPEERGSGGGDGEQQKKHQHDQGRTAKEAVAGGAAAGPGADLETGDVTLQRQLDQLRQQFGGAQQGGRQGRPLGEAKERRGGLAMDPAAVNRLAQAGEAGGSCERRARSHAAAGPGPSSRAASGALARGCGAGGGIGRYGAPGNNSRTGPGRAGLGADLGKAAAPAPVPHVMRPRLLVDLVESGKSVRRSALGRLHAQLKSGAGKAAAFAAAAAAAAVPPPPALFRRVRASADGTSGANRPHVDPVPVPAPTDDGTGVVRRWGRSSGPGPVAESTMSNPLFSNQAPSPTGGYGANGMGGGYNMYGAGGTGMGGGMGMYGNPYGGMGTMQGGMIQAQQPMQQQKQQQWGMGGTGMALGGAGVVAALPYGGSGAAGPSAVTDGAAPNGAGAAVVGPDGQWGSNPSSGGQEGSQEGGEADADAAAVEEDVSGLRSSSSGSANSVTSSEARRRQLAEKMGEGDADSEVHSERSILEHELAAGIEEKIIRLFFFGRPYLLLWVFNVIFAQASLIMTMSMAFVIPYDKFDYIREVAMPTYIWLPVVLINFLLVFYGCWVFLPQYALLSVTGVLEPHEVMAEIKRSKTQDDSEEGVAAVVLGKLTEYFVGKHDGETNLSTAFIVLLASQAGIILGRDYKANKQINKTALKNMFTELVLVWHDIAWYGELTSTYRIKTKNEIFEEAFKELDEDGSGALSFGELANMIRSLGTYATAGDVEAMLWEIDIDNSHSIGYDEFVKFLTYAFFDTKQLGYIDTESLLDGMERLGLPINEMQAAVLMAVGHCEPGEEVKVTLRQFFEMYEKVSFDDEEEEDEAEGNNGSILGKAWDVLRTPSVMFVNYIRREVSNLSAARRDGSSRGLPKVASNSLLARATSNASGVIRAASVRQQPSSSLHLSAQGNGMSGAGISRSGTSGLGGGGMETGSAALCHGGVATGGMTMGISMGSFGPGVGSYSMNGGPGGMGGSTADAAASVENGGGGGWQTGPTSLSGPTASGPSIVSGNLKGPSRLAVMSRANQ